MLLAANLISLAAMIIMCLCGLIKKKHQFVLVQMVYTFLMAVANVVLGAMTGAIVDLVGIVRNGLAYKDRLKGPFPYLLAAISVVLCLLFNQHGLLGILPLFSTVPYTLLMGRCNDRQMKLLTIFSTVFWAFYDFGVQNYVAGSFDVGMIVTCLIGLRGMKRTLQFKG